MLLLCELPGTSAEVKAASGRAGRIALTPIPNLPELWVGIRREGSKSRKKPVDKSSRCVKGLKEEREARRGQEHQDSNSTVCRFERR